MHSSSRRGWSFLLLSTTAPCAVLACAAVAAGQAGERPLTGESTMTTRAATGTGPVDDLRQRVNEAFSLSDSTLLSLMIDTTPEVPVTAIVPLGGIPSTLDLVPHTVRAPGYQLVTEIDGGALVPVDPGPLRTLRGAVLEQPGSRVAASMLEDGLHALIVRPDGTRFWLQPVGGVVEGAGPDQYVLYDDEDVIPSGGTCGVTEQWLQETAVPGGHPLAGTSGPGGTGGQGGTAGLGGGGGCYWTTELALEADFAYFEDYGSVAAVEGKINQIINIMNTQYEEDVEITHVITGILVRTSEEEDPYTTNSASGLLDQFRDEWVVSPPLLVPRDVTHLFTGRNLSGSTIGIAWTLGGICTTSAYCLAESDCCSPNLACATDLSAHELGHLWNGSHCSCNSPAYTMNPSITCINRFNPIFTIPDIIEHRDSRPCLANMCAPVNDECADASVVSDGAHLFSTIAATTDGPVDNLCNTNGDPQVSGDVWFRYIAPCDGDVSIDICDSSFDSRVAVYPTFCPLISNSAIACNDNACGLAGELTFAAQGGHLYLIRIGGTGDAEGTGTLTITGPTCIPAPANNSCGNAAAIGEGSTVFTTVGATTDGPLEGAVCGGSGEISNDVWFRYMPTCDEIATVSICDAEFDARIAIYGQTCPGAPDEAIACVDGGCDSDSISFPVSAGNIYRIRVGGNGATGAGTVSLTCGPADDCNGNGISDADDISDGFSADCNANALPDECDLAGGTSTDDNGNGVPDECDPACPTDIDGNGATDVDDLVAIVVAWGSSDETADVDGSGTVDVDDLVEVVLGWGPCL